MNIHENSSPFLPFLPVHIVRNESPTKEAKGPSIGMDRKYTHMQFSHSISPPVLYKNRRFETFEDTVVFRVLPFCAYKS